MTRGRGEDAGPLFPDGSLSLLTADQLKAIGKRWIGKEVYKLRKQEIAQVLSPALRDPARVAVVVAGLHPEERALLSVLRRSGGVAPAEAAALALQLGGTRLPEGPRAFRDPYDELIQKLADGGVLLRIRSREHEHDPFRRGGGVLVADPRILLAVPPSPPVRLPLPAPDPDLPAAPAMRVAALALDLIRILESIGDGAGLVRTNTGGLRVADLRRLDKALGWDRQVPEAMAELREPLFFFLALLRGAGLLVEEGGALRVPAGALGALQAPPADIAARLLAAYLRLDGWEERGWDRWEIRHSGLPPARRMLIEALRGLAAGAPGFYDVQALSGALFAAVGDRPLLSDLPVTVVYLSFERNGRDERRVDAQRSWTGYTAPLIEAALRGPLRALGFVEVSAGAGPLRVRLTELGRSALLPEAAPAPAAEASTGRAFVVQATFEVLALLEHASPAELALLERYAERRERHAHTATYRLTEASLCAGLDRGGDAQSLIAALERGSGRALPQNVRSELLDWARRRDRLRLRRAARLLEYPSAAMRDAAVEAGRPAGTPLGDRFLLLAPDLPPDAIDAIAAERIDYRAPLPRCLKAEEDGTLRLLPEGPRPDLLLPSELERFAEPAGPGRWRLTQGSIERYRAAGGRRADLEAFLFRRAERPLPPLLLVALRGRFGELSPATLGPAVVLQCPDAATAEAAALSPALRPHLLGALGPTALLIDPPAAAEVRRLLGQIGVPLAPPPEAEAGGPDVAQHAPPRRRGVRGGG